MAYFRCNQIALIDKTASGAVASFSDGIGGVPFVDLTAEIVPTQEGTGDPGPENKRLLHGFTGGNIVRAGKNLYNDDPTKYTKPHDYYICPIVLKSGYRYRASARLKPGKTALSGYLAGIVASGDRYTNFTNRQTIITSVGTPSEVTVLIDSTWTAPKLIIFAPNDGSVADIFETYELQLEIGSTTTSYEKYVAEVFPVTWLTEAGEIFGGTIKIVSGVLTVTHGIVVYNGSEADWDNYNAQNGFYRALPEMSSGNWQSGLCDKFKVGTGDTSIQCIRLGASNSYIYFNHIKDSIADISSLATWKTWLASNNVTVVYPLATPQTYQLSATEVLALLGNNNVISDTGNTEVTYKAKP